MKFNLLVIFGILFLVLGITALVNPEIKLPAKHDELQIGQTKVPIETRRIVTVPGVVGCLIVLCGAGMVILGARKN